MATILSLDSLMRWSYCSMMYYFRDTLGLPSFCPTIQTSWDFMVRSAIRTYFNSESKDLANGITLATSRIEAWHRAALGKYLGRAGHKMIRYLRGEALLTLGTLRDLYDRRRDTIIDTMIPYAYRLDIGEEQYEIRDRIDVLYFYNDKVYSKKVARAILLTHTGDPILDAPRFRGVRPGMLKSFLRKELEIPVHVPLEVVYVPCRGDATVVPISRQCEDEAENFFKEVIPHLGLKIPTGQYDKCQHCPYNTVCSSSGPDPEREYLMRAVKEHATTGMFLDAGD